MSLRPTTTLRIGTLSTWLANTVLYAGHWAQLSSPFSTLVLGGAVFRVLTLPLTIYGDQCLSRTATALPELQEAHHQYTDIVNHPKAIVWERRVAAQKLKNDRERIFRSHRTNNVKMMAPHMAGLLASWYMLGIPSQQLGEFFTQDAGMDIASPLAVTIWQSAGSGAWAAARAVDLGSAATATTTTTTAAAAAAAATASSSSATSVAFSMTIDPTLTLAATLTLYNVLQHLRRREGFNNRLDQYIRDAKRLCCGGYGFAATAGLVATPIASIWSTAVFFPSYLGPIWLGMAATTFVKTLLLNNTAPGRALCHIQPYPPEHGTYGGESTAEGHEYRLAFTGVDAEEKRDVWQTQKRALDYECDVRLHKFLSKTGLFDPVEELEYEAERLKERRQIAHERAMKRKATADTVKAEGTEAEKTETTDGDDDGNEGGNHGSTAPMTAVQRRRLAREEKKRNYQRQIEEREKLRQAEIAAAKQAAAEKGEDARPAVAATRTGASTAESTQADRSDAASASSAFPSKLRDIAAPASAYKNGEPVATDFADQYLDQYNIDMMKRRVDRQTARESQYRQRSPLSPTEHLLGSKEAAEAATVTAARLQMEEAEHARKGDGGRARD